MEEQIEEKLELDPKLEMHRELIESMLSPKNHTNFVNLLNNVWANKVRRVLTTPTNSLLCWLETGSVASSASQTITDEKLRLSFWMEFDRCSVTGSRMEPHRIYHNICSEAQLHRVFGSSDKLLYILTPPGKYQTGLEAVLVKLTERLYEIAKIPLTDSKGKYDMKAANVVLKAYALLDIKVNGPMKIKHEHDVKVSRGQDTPMELTADEKKAIQMEVEKEVLMIQNSFTGPQGKADIVEVEDVVREEKRDNRY